MAEERGLHDRRQYRFGAGLRLTSGPQADQFIV
jgi:hypothetical protein